ncbi:TPA: hypothetical protein DEO28_04790 [Candidatus Dependentiae bacterium]|nr:MAG: GCN5-related N-acetyltransferase [candidate division TM6 bacterium GW2011_GWE2_31_21]KKP53869.1 MAG: GCN5-related N-acetyltransferase [candidate division TM6 bacterium GW2011_GWF2_33_332]HBS47649.1 hypothetical protein [Candidatus Dependentiae bacterium]HBZ73798.1 hypothetical protein [Candidatus Dependentiae bacterium]
MNIFKKYLATFFFAATIVIQPLQSNGYWNETDKKGTTIIIEWEKFDQTTIPFFNRFKELAPIEAAAFANQDKTDEALLYSQRIDEYNFMISKIQKEGPLNETNFIVTSKELDGTILGFTIFHIQSDSRLGYVELEPLCIHPSAQGRGLSRFLVFSILKILPEIKEIGLITDMSNIQAITVYKKLGFFESRREGSPSLCFTYKVGILKKTATL